MAPFEIKNANILNKILFLKEYLKKTDENKTKDGASISTNGVDENELIELAENFEETYSLSDMEGALKDIHTSMDKDANGKIDSSEMTDFQEILDKAGISYSELTSLYNQYKGDVSSDVSEINSNEIENLDKETFKNILIKHPVINEIIEKVGYDEFFKLLDSNSDGVIDEDEKSKITGLDSNTSVLSVNDIKSFIEKNGIKIDDTDKKVQDELKQLKDDEENFNKLVEALRGKLPETNGQETVSDDALGMADGAQEGYYDTGYDTSSYDTGSYAPVNYSSGGSVSSGSYTGEIQQTKSKIETIEEQIDDLNKEKTQEEETLKEKNTTLSDALNGKGDGLDELKDKMDEAEGNYKELLEDEAENDPKVKEIKENIDENESDLKTNEEETLKAEENLNEYQNSISSKKDEIKGLESAKSALDSALSSLNATKETDVNKQELAQKKADVQNQISAKESEIKAKNEELKELEEKEENEKNHLEDLKDKKEELETARDELEEKLKDTVSDTTKKALEEYQSARETFEKTKSDKVSEAKSDIQTSQSKISDINNQIQALEAEKIKEENQLSAWGQYNEERGHNLAQAALSLHGNTTRGGGYCATGVGEAINKAFGYRPRGNGCDYDDILSQRSDWKQVWQDKDITVEDLKQLPEGAIVSWSAYDTPTTGRLYGHVYIVAQDENGNKVGVSDFKENITDSYLRRNSKPSVFLPT